VSVIGWHLKHLRYFLKKVPEHSNMPVRRITPCGADLYAGQDRKKSKRKKIAIGVRFLIANFHLRAACQRFNLQGLEYLKHSPGSQSRSTWEQSLAPIALKTNFSSLRSPTA